MARPNSIESAVRVTVRAKPRAKASRITRAEGLLVIVSIAAPPVDGAANDELVTILARALSVPKRAVRLLHGGASKNKVAEVMGLTEAEVVRLLAEAAS
jgi:uncharacterized protein YggU (UPF0235/DUF167 family)